MSVSSVAAGQPAALEDVRARIYSTTAAEIQWSRLGNESVHISYNGQLLGQYDSSSLFRADLDPDVEHLFELRTLDNSGQLSQPQFLRFATGDFTLPIREVQAESSSSVTSGSSGNDTGQPDLTGAGVPGSTASLSNVRAKIYSSTAAELLWTRNNADGVRVVHNNNNLGVLDTSSLYLGALDPSVRHQFELTAVNGDGTPGERYQLGFTMSSFAGVVQTIDAVKSNAASDSGVSTATPDPTAQPAAPPPPPPASTPVQNAPASDSGPQMDDPLEVTVTGSGTESESESETQSETGSETGSIQSGDCVVRSLSQLSSCVDAAAGYSRINIQSDLSCSTASCCPTGGALLAFANTRDLIIQGNGHRLTRRAGQRQCSLLDVTNSRSLRISNWHLDDDASVSPCLVTDRCPRMLHIRNSSGITLDGVHVSNGKGYVIYVQQVDDFQFINSSLKNSGVLGLYVGHSGSPSTNVLIHNSTFTDNQTNALALLGVTGSSRDSNVISNNVFRRNHYRGQFPVAPRYGSGFTGGGQVYIAEASGLTIRGNLIDDGYCENCYVQQRFGSGVSGIELAIPGRNSVSNTLITDNTVSDHDAWGIFVNAGSTLDSSVVISNNRLLDNTVGLKPGAASTSGNLIRDR